MSDPVETIKVTSADAGLRLDKWFKTHFPDVTHGYLQKLLRSGQVRLDAKRVQANARLEAGQQARVPAVIRQPAKARQPTPKSLLCLAARIAANAPISVKQAKKSIDKATELDRQTGYAFADGCAAERVDHRRPIDDDVAVRVGRHACQNANATAPIRQTSDAALFHRNASPIYRYANAVNTMRMMASWMIFS